MKITPQFVTSNQLRQFLEFENQAKILGPNFRHTLMEFCKALSIKSSSQLHVAISQHIDHSRTSRIVSYLRKSFLYHLRFCPE